MQNSRRAGRGGLLRGLDQLGMFSHTARTGEVNWPDWEQKWQSSGQPPVLRRDDALDLDLRTAVGHPHLVRQLQQLGEPLVGQPQHLDQVVVRRAPPRVQRLAAGPFQDVSRRGRRQVRRSLRSLVRR